MAQKFEYVAFKENGTSGREFENCVEDVTIRLKDTEGNSTLIKLFPVGDKLILDCYQGDELEIHSNHDGKYKPIMDGSVQVRVRKEPHARGRIDKSSEEKPIWIPTNLEECFTAIKERVKEREIKEFKEASEEVAIALHHFGFGQWMRNNWGLWSGSKLKDWFVEKGIEHADDMSGIILVSLWRSLNNKPIGLDDQIEIYKDYWKTVLEERK